jgi:hypothetical protein
MDQKMDINRYFVKKILFMSTTQLREQLHEYINKADERLLNLIHGMFQADIQKQDWWDELHPNLQASIDRAIDQLNRGEGRPHEEVMKGFREKYKK